MKISIITVCRNAAETIFDCLASVRGQVVGSNLTIEHVVCDGASTDGTWGIVRDFRDSHEHAPFFSYRIFSERDGGLYDALNKGVARATGDVVGILHADDFYASPDTLLEIASAFSAPEAQTCYGDLAYVKEEPARSGGSPFHLRRYWHSGPFRSKEFYAGWMPPHPTFFVRKNLYQRLGGFRTDLGTAADYELMLRYLLKHNTACQYLPKVLVCMRVGGASNSSLGARLQANRADRKAWRVNGVAPLPWTTLLKPLRKLRQWSCRGAFSPVRWWTPRLPANLVTANLTLPIIVFTGLFALPSADLQAQDGVFRYSLAGPHAYAKGRVLPPKGGIRIGNLYVQTAASLTTEYNSNVTYSKQDPIQDFYITPQVAMSAVLPLTEVNSLSLNFSVAYQQGFNKKDPNRNQIMFGGGTTAVDLRAYAGDFMFRLYDAPELSSVPGDDPTLTNVTDYSIFQNTAGFAVTMDLYKFISTLGVEWRTQRSLGSGYGYLNQNNYVAYLTAFVPVTSTFSVGGFATAFSTLYSSSSLANSYSFTAGASLEGSLTRYTDVSFQAGVQYIFFNGGSPTIAREELNGTSDIPGATFDDDSYIGPYLQLSINNRLSRDVSQMFSISNQAIPSTTADFAYYLSGSYQVNWQFASHWSTSVSAQAGYGNNQGFYNDIFVLTGGAWQLSYSIDKRTMVYLDATYFYRTSKSEELSYGAYTGGAGIVYNF